MGGKSAVDDDDDDDDGGHLKRQTAKEKERERDGARHTQKLANANIHAHRPGILQEKGAPEMRNLLLTTSLPALMIVGLASGSHLAVLDQSGRSLNLAPGLLDDTLLSEGSFSFGAKLVKFDKLNVLGNVYVRRINGKRLREAYLLRSNLDKPAGRQYQPVDQDSNNSLTKEKRSRGRSDREEMRLLVLQ